VPGPDAPSVIETIRKQFVTCDRHRRRAKLPVRVPELANREDHGFELPVQRVVESPTMAARGFVWRHSRAGIAAAAEALFPENDYGAPDWQSTEMVDRTNDYLEALPREQRRLITTLFLVLELGTLVLVQGFRRYSHVDVERRAEIIRTWRRSRFFVFRIVGDAVKATTTIIYMSHPLALAHIGAYKTCERPDDPLPFRVEPTALEKMAPR
jgi:hypothetical protein